MFTASFIVVIVATIATWPLLNSFLKSVRRESPELYQSWGEPTLGKYLRGRQFFNLFSSMFLFRKYRDQLKDCPHSRAWGSWLSLVFWVRLVAVASLMVAFARTYA
jgi:hypothetical protein